MPPPRVSGDGEVAGGVRGADKAGERPGGFELLLSFSSPNAESNRVLKMTKKRRTNEKGDIERDE